MKRNLVIFILLISIVLSIILGCGRKTDEVGVGPDDAASTMDGESETVRDNRLEVPDVREGVIEFLSGDVEWSSGTDSAWYPAEIGQMIRSGDSVRTFADSWCEVKFVDMAVIRLHGDTEFTLESAYDEESSAARLDGQVLKGTVAAKVRQLAGRESLQLRTQTVVCAVRGTVFLVSTDDERTDIAVSEGRVAVVPAALNLDERKQNATGNEKEVLDQLENSMPVLEAGEEITLGAREQDELIRTADTINQVLDEGETEIGDVESMSTQVAQAIGVMQDLSDESEAILLELDRVEISQQITKEGPIRVAMSWEVTPSDAFVKIDDEITGFGRISGNWTVGDTVTILASKQGYKEYSGSFTAAESDDYRPQVIALEKLPTRYFDLVLSQEEGSIFVDGQDKGTSYSAAVPWGGNAHIRLTAAGYNERRMQVSYEDAPTGRIEVDLDPIISSSMPVVTGSIIGLEATDSSLVLADQEGTLIAVDGAGNRLWREVTTNTPNDDARPHRIGNALFFSGIGEFVILDGGSGEEIYRMTLSPQTMHLFGRHSVPFGDIAVYPTRDELIFMDPASGSEKRRVSVPGGSQMTPAEYSGNLWIVAEDGVFYGFDSDGNSVGRIPTGADRPIGHAPAVAGGTAFFGDRSGNVRGVDLNNRRVVWETSVGAAIQDEIAVSGSNLVVYANHDVFVLDRVSGKIRLPVIRGFGAPPLVAENFLYGGTEDGELLAINIQSGEVVARETINGQVRSGGILWNDRVYFGTNQGELIAMNLQDASLLQVPPEPEVLP